MIKKSHQKNEIWDTETASITISQDNREMFESFCKRNHIPLCVLKTQNGTICYTIRAGMDHDDALSFYWRLRLQSGHQAELDINEINNLTLTHIFKVIHYEYENYVSRTREDKILLSQYVD